MLSSRQSGMVKHPKFPAPNTLKKAASGYAIAIRNMASQPIRVGGTLRIRKPDYPCTLLECCGLQVLSILALLVQQYRC